MTIAAVAYQIENRPILRAIQAGTVAHEREFKGVFAKNAKWFAVYKTPWGARHEPTYLSELEFTREEAAEAVIAAADKENKE
jgi:hypothetical protein